MYIIDAMISVCREHASLNSECFNKKECSLQKPNAKLFRFKINNIVEFQHNVDRLFYLVFNINGIKK